MDEGFFPAYYEDVDLGLRLRAAGWCCRFEPDAVVVHNESASLDERRKVLAHRLGEARFRARWFGAGEPPPCRQFTDHGERMLAAARAAADFERRLADELAADLDQAVAARDWAQGELDRLQPLYHRHAAESAEREALLAETAAEVERLRAALEADGGGGGDRPRRRWLR
jgi:hypothetical protein